MRTSIQNLIIGGGPAGSMLAIRLASAGREVMLLEKQREPHHKVCGEFLSAEAVTYLRRAGLDLLDLSAQAIQHVRLHSGRRCARAALPFTALSLSRRVLDSALLELAEAAGCEVGRGAFVENLSRTRDGFSVQLRSGETIVPRNVFVATGKHDLSAIPRGTGTHSDLVGFKMHWQLGPAQLKELQGKMDLFLFRDGYGGLSLVEHDTANLCFVVRQRRLRALGGWPALVVAIREEVRAIDRILTGAIQCWSKPLAISPIPYGYFARSANGIWLVGDQAAVIPSFTGDGMSIALHSANLAADMYLARRTPDEYLHRLYGQLRSGMQLSTSLSRLIVKPAVRVLAPLALSIAPRAMSWIAARTRIPSRALSDIQSSADNPVGRSPAPAA